MPYRAVPSGPVPSEYGRLFLRLQEDRTIFVEERDGKGDQYLEVYHPKIQFDDRLFSEAETKILQRVAQSFNHTDASDIVRLSYEEQAWKDNQADYQFIDYQRYAFEVGENMGLSN